MAERLADIVTQIENVRQLDAVVTAMRGIAASRTQKSRSLLAGIDAYNNVISRAIGQALSLLPMDITTAPQLRRGRTGLWSSGVSGKWGRADPGLRAERNWSRSMKAASLPPPVC
jgi:hypothetical protein